MPKKTNETVPDKDAQKIIELSSSITVRDLAKLLGTSGAAVVRQLLQNGVKANLNKTIDYETAAIISADFGYEAIEESVKKPVQATSEKPSPKPVAKAQETQGEKDLQPRPAVITVMGHIDHGKTSLLDAIRQANVIATEAGGITQHIGAYQVEVDGQKVTFLDTPGHEAFTAMRARGTNITDIAVLVVAADDGVMPTTREAIAHARAADVPIVVAINKIDKPDVNLGLLKQQLADEGLMVEEWGGDIISVPVSAKMKEGINELLESILLVAEMLQLKANPDSPAEGVVVEAGLDKTKGSLATLLVKNGTLKQGDAVIVGDTWGKIRAMFDDAGGPIKTAMPSTPVKVLGLNSVPQAGDTFRVVASEKEARLSVQKQQERQKESIRPSSAFSLDDLMAKSKEEQIKELNIILKADVQGSIEPIKDSLQQLESEEVKIKIINSGSGNITESDVMLALASHGLIIGFNSNPAPSARRLAEAEGVDIRYYNIIYDLIEDIEAAVKGMKEPRFAEVVEGHAEARTIFSSGKYIKIAGCYILDGKVSRDSRVRVIRQKQLIYEGNLHSLRRFKDDVKEVSAGFECGIRIEGFNQFEEGDIIEAYRKERVDESSS